MHAGWCHTAGTAAPARVGTRHLPKSTGQRLGPRARRGGPGGGCAGAGRSQAVQEEGAARAGGPTGSCLPPQGHRKSRFHSPTRLPGPRQEALPGAPSNSGRAWENAWENQVRPSRCRPPDGTRGPPAPAGRWLQPLRPPLVHSGPCDPAGQLTCVSRTPPAAGGT